MPADVADGVTVARTVREHGLRGVVHLAAKKQVEGGQRDQGHRGAAIQCANLALGLPEATGLPVVGVAP